MNPTPTLTGPSVPGEVFYPSGDGLPMAEAELHFWVIVALAEMLREHFSTLPDVHVGGNVNLYYEQGNPNAKRAPDVMVVKGVDDAKRYRDSFLLWQENAVPCAVIEVTSKTTAEEDTGPKRELYERLGVREYFLFDPRSEHLPRQLMGYRLVKVAEGNGDNGVEVRQQYDELVAAADGSLLSAELGLRLVPRGIELDLVNPVTRQRLLPPREKTEQLAHQQQRADQAEQDRDEALKQSEEALRQAEQAGKQSEEDRRLREEAQKQSAEDRRLREEALKQSEEALRQTEQARKQSAEDRRLREEAMKQSQEATRRAELAEKERAELIERVERVEKERAERAEQAEKDRQLREELEEELRRRRAAPPSEPPADSGD
jgi:Uma2 family endonuclease